MAKHCWPWAKHVKNLWNFSKFKWKCCNFRKLLKHLCISNFWCQTWQQEKTKIITNNHLTDISLENNYLNIISLKKIKMLIFLAKSNKFKWWKTDIFNTYLKTYIWKKVTIKAKLKFRLLHNYMLIITKTLYKLHFSGKMWHDFFAYMIKKIQTKLCKIWHLNVTK